MSQQLRVPAALAADLGWVPTPTEWLTRSPVPASGHLLPPLASGHRMHVVLVLAKHSQKTYTGVRGEKGSERGVGVSSGTVLGPLP